MKLEKIGTADRMMFYISSGDENSYVNQVNMTLKDQINPLQLEQAVEIALKTFHNFKMRIVVKDEVLYYTENHGKLPVFPKEDKIYHLGTEDTNQYMFRISYEANKFELSYFHGTTDAIGASMFLMTILDEYFRMTEAEYAGAVTEPVADSMEIVDIEDPFAEYASHKLMPFSLPNTRKVFSVQGKGEESESYAAQKYMLTVPREQVYTAAKANKTTPVAFFMTALAEAINKSYEVGKKEHIVCMLPANLRTVYNANVCRNFSHVVILPFKKEYEKQSFAEQCVSMRADLKALTAKKAMSKALQQQVIIANFLENNKKPLIERSRQMVRSFMEGSDSMCTYEISYLGNVTMPEGIKERVESISYSHRGCSGFPWILIYADNQEMRMEFINYTGGKKLIESLQEVLKAQGCESVFGVSESEILDKFVLASALE